MARNGWVNRLLDMIGLVDDGDEPQQEKNDRSRQSASGSGSARSSAFGSGSRYSSRNEESEGSGARRRDNDGSGYSSYRSNFERSASAGRTYSTRTEEPQDDRDDLEKAFDNMGSSSSRQRTSGPRRSAQASSAAGTQTRTAQHGSTGTKIHHVNMHALEECRAIIRDLAEGSVVIVNLENIDDRLLQRALDTLGGAACALHQWMEPVGDRMYMIGSKAVQFDHNYDYSRTMDDRYDR